MSSKTATKPAIISIAVVTFTYVIAVIQRSSLGVAALEASTRFEVSAATLSALAVFQLAMYALMQIPAGIFLDRFGTKAALTLGTLVMGMGQLVVAVVPVFGFAVAGRIFVGLGDAFIFISLVRIVNAWFKGKTASRTQQIVANVGQLGQIFSALPFHLVLTQMGWTPAFAMLSSLALIAVLAVLTLLVEPHYASSPRSLKDALFLLRKNLGHPATRMGFWTHFSLQSSGSSFILLWGYPFLVKAQNLNPSIATALLSSFVFIGFVFGPYISGLAARFPTRRSNVVLAIGLVIATSWLLVCLSSSSLPLAGLLLFVLVIGIGGPASILAFDYSRRFIEPGHQGSANGFINMGGFVAAFSLMFLVGYGLDFAVSNGFSTQQYGLESFRLAFLFEPAVIVFGLIMFMFERKKLRAKVLLEEGIIIRPLHVVVREKLATHK